MSSSPEDTDDEQQRARRRYDQTTALVRRIGYVIFFGGALLISIPMIVSAIQGIQADRVWDPFTGNPVAVDEAEFDCIAEASDLAFLAGEHRELDSQWEQRYRRWRLRCEGEYGELRDVLKRVRGQLRGSEEHPELDEIDENRADDPSE